MEMLPAVLDLVPRQPATLVGIGRLHIRLDQWGYDPAATDRDAGGRHNAHCPGLGRQFEWWFPQRVSASRGFLARRVRNLRDRRGHDVSRCISQRSQAGDTPGYVICRPFVNALTNAADCQIVSQQGIVSGNAAINAVSSDFWGADVAFRKLACCNCNGRLDWLVGYRFLSYGDSVRISENLTPTAPVFVPGTRIGVTDAFTAQNQFHGALFALAGEYRMGSWYVAGRGGVSLGGTFRKATISGSTTVQVPPGPPVTLPGGLLALSSNSGTFSGSEWVFMPEASLRVGYQITQHLRVYGGYSFLYWPGVYRAADQIDPVVNPGLLPPPVVPLAGPVRPLFPNQLSSLWVQAVSFGVELRY